MAPLELDHLFCFVEPGFVDSAAHQALRRFGLTVDFGRRHLGQGTANRLALFPQHSLEFLWLADRGEAERNPLRLERRSDWRSNGGNPFGLCLRGHLDGPWRDRWFWPYSLPGSSGSPLWIARLSDELHWPMVFVIDSDTDTRPRAQGHDMALFDHAGGQSGIGSATLTCRVEATAWPEPLAQLLPANVELHAGAEASMEIRLHGRRADRLQLGPLMLETLPDDHAMMTDADTGDRP
jgi:hypothetical protein